MSRRPRNSEAPPQGTPRILAVGVLIGSLLLTAVLATTDIAIDSLSMSILLGSLALLVIALALKAKGIGTKAKGDNTAPTAAPRPQFGRGEAD